MLKYCMLPISECFCTELEGTASYAGLLLAPAEKIGLPEAFFALWAKKRAFHTVCAYFRQFLVFSSNLINFEKNKINQ